MNVTEDIKKAGNERSSVVNTREEKAIQKQMFCHLKIGIVLVPQVLQKQLQLTATFLVIGIMSFIALYLNDLDTTQSVKSKSI